MKKFLKHVCHLVLDRFMPKDWQLVDPLISLANYLEIDLLYAAYKSKGILRYQNSRVSGESYVLKHVLPKHLCTDKTYQPVFFDVGANIGEYSVELRNQFPQACIYAFEPNPETYKELIENVAGCNIHTVNVGLAAESKQSKLYLASSDQTSQHASLFKDVAAELHKASTITEFDMELLTVNDFCTEYKIDTIDFLKIDTEGNELAVLQGALHMLENRVRIIQFEFNEMNIISRVFLRDFYKVLANFELYRLSEKGLLPLPDYTSTNEIFQFQNFLAINKNHLA